MHKGIVPLVALAALIGALSISRTDRFHAPLSRIVALSLLGVCAWAALSAFWALDETEAAVGALKLLGNFAIGVLFLRATMRLTEADKTFVSRLLVAGWIGGLLIVATEILLKGPIFNALFGINYNAYPNGPYWLNAGITILILVYWPVSRVLRQIWGLWAPPLAFFLLLGAAYLINFDGGIVALCFGALAVGVVRMFGRKAVWAFIAIILALGIATPSVVHQLGNPIEAALKYPELPMAAQHRIAIWAFVSQRIAEHPILGWGMNASKMMPGGKEPILLSPKLNLGETLPLHPHNAVLQIWLELGAVGFGLYFLVVAGTMLGAMRSSAPPLAIGQVGAILAIANLSYGIWQAWWIAAIWFAAGMMVIATSPTQPKPAL